MKVRSRYDFRNSHFPVLGSNGNPFGPVNPQNKPNTITFSSDGAKLSSGGGDGITVDMPGTLDFTAGYEFEFKMRGGITPADTTMFTSTAIKDINTGAVAVSVSREVNPLNQGSMQHAASAKLTADHFFIYSPTDFHTYKIVYDATAGTGSMYRDGALIKTGAINPPDLNKVHKFYMFGVPGGRVTTTGHPLEVEYYEIYAQPEFAVAGVVQPDRHISRGIARGFERGIV